ncbi:hypothetical protein HETIRDRAFT_327870 [Heterobasidion irregulare TC 32-1]|uniref:Uncharacterized protein n=1 Tax=Heterobasidion irregulare (strain TC 32-1) TaxID=747525 RepID=W4JST2_HETIT|nr:uncharacterized protein HETIRDRAFT_327870 [Heterobasidion irregulare TC 32-1]ETW76598.1 hypothetical protein HETIRDRAFT_327870 [Heterobasidion irregulare TC 32-1]
MLQLFKGFVPLMSPLKWYILLCEVIERSCRGSEVFDESAIEVSKAEERLYFFQVLQGWPGGDSINLDRVHGYIIRGNDKSEVFDCVRLKGAFRRLQEQVVVQKYLHDLGCHAPMLFNGLREHQDVIHVDCKDLRNNEVMEDDVHHSLKGGRRVAKTKEHYKAFKQAEFSHEGCLPFVTFCYSNVIIPPFDIKLGEDPCF